jgi:hypothetical protein
MEKSAGREPVEIVTAPASGQALITDMNEPWLTAGNALE